MADGGGAAPPAGKPPRYEIIKTYGPRGPLQQYRLASLTSFQCFRCGRDKKSKLITLFRKDWRRLLCNGCYGRLLSLYELKAGSAGTDQTVELLSRQLLKLASANDVRQTEAVLRVRHQAAHLLDERALRLLATSEYVAGHLKNATDLDWSAAVIGISKAVEVEVVVRLVQPIAEACAGVDLAADIGDKDLGRMARFCSGDATTPPELGVVRHFLQTAANSKSRQETSPLLGVLRQLLQRWPHSDWLLAKDGAVPALGALSTTYRNRAAHTDELGAADYDGCVHLATGDAGLLWKLLRSTTPATRT